MNEDKPSVVAQRLKIAVGITAVVVGVWFVYTVRAVLGPFAMAFVLAYVLTPVVDQMEGRGLQRTLSILIIFAVTSALLVLGLVTAGKTLTEEMLQLSEEFMRPESVTQKLTITNNTSSPVTVGASWDSPQAAAVFSLSDSAQLPAELVPGAEVTLRLAYAPAKVKRDRGFIRLTRDGHEVAAEIPVEGNAPKLDLGVPKEAATPAHAEVDWGGVTLSQRRLDFGQAGPNVLTHISALANELEPYVEPYLGKEMDLAQLIKKHGTQLINILLGRTTDLLGGVFSGMMLVVIVPFVAFFFLKEGRRITHGMVELVPNAYFELTLNLLHQINGQIGGYIRGQLLSVFLVASLSVTGLFAVRMPYFLPVGVLAGVANMIPYLGPLIGIVSATIVALAMGKGFGMVMWVIIVFLIIQIIDNILIQPMVVAKSVDLHPLIVLVVVMIGSDLMGIVGMLVAVPLTGILKVSSQTVYEGIKGYRTQ